MKKQKFLFDHVEKTGGSSLHNLFHSMFGPYEVRQHLGSSHKGALDKYREYMMISGHFWFRPGECFHTDRYYLTILREPVDRALSLYYYYRNNVNHLTGPHIQAVKCLTVEDYFLGDSKLILGPISNHQTKHFIQLEVDGGNGLTEIEQLDLAKKALAKYDLVGVHPHLQEFIDIMCYDNQLPPVDHVPRFNVTSKRPKINEVDSKIIDCLRELNTLDTGLFEYATELFQKQRSRIIRECIQQNETRDSSHVGLESQEAYGLVNSTDETKSDERADFDNRRIEITKTEVVGALFMNASLLSGETAELKSNFTAHEPADDLTVGIKILNHYGDQVYGTNSQCHISGIKILEAGDYFLNFTFRNDLGLGDYSVTVALHTGAIKVEIRNTGKETWPVHGQQPVHFSYHWSDLQNKIRIHDGIRTELPRDILPGETFVLVGVIRALDHKCEAVLKLTLVQEGVSWFDEHDECPVYRKKIKIVDHDDKNDFQFADGLFKCGSKVN